MFLILNSMFTRFAFVEEEEATAPLVEVVATPPPVQPPPRYTGYRESQGAGQGRSRPRTRDPDPWDQSGSGRGRGRGSSRGRGRGSYSGRQQARTPAPRIIPRRVRLRSWHGLSDPDDPRNLFRAIYGYK